MLLFFYKSQDYHLISPILRPVGSSHRPIIIGESTGVYSVKINSPGQVVITQVGNIYAVINKGGYFAVESWCGDKYQKLEIRTF